MKVRGRIAACRMAEYPQRFPMIFSWGGSIRCDDSFSRFPFSASPAGHRQLRSNLHRPLSLTCLHPWSMSTYHPHPHRDFFAYLQSLGPLIATAVAVGVASMQ
jgi:hypothetical protein